jgi:broad specificity phosphatase PhoE
MPNQVELLLASPLRRALQTCELSFAPVVKRGLKIVALPIAEEASDAPCDTGSEVDVLKAEFPDIVDFDHVKHGWYVHEGEYAVDPKSLNARAAKLRRFIRDRPEKEVVLVSHGFFNHYITGDVNEKGEQTTPWWKETELRTFVFLDGGEEAMIKETDESMLRRGAMEDGECCE